MPDGHAWQGFPADDGTLTTWPAGTVFEVAIQLPLPDGLDEAGVLAAVRGAFDAWLDHTECGVPRLGAIRFDAAAERDILDGVVAILWSTEPAANQGELGHVLPTARIATGHFIDVDIVIGAADFTFAAPTGEACAVESFDLRAILTHEVGHLLGLDHSDVPGAAMVSSTSGQTCEGRLLAPDDVAGLCVLYPPAANEGSRADCAAGDTGMILGLLSAALALAAATRSARTRPVT